MNHTSTRRLIADNQKQMRVKSRVAAWWQTERNAKCDCAACRLGMRGTVVSLDNLPEGLAAALGRLAGDIDDGGAPPTKAH